MSRSFDAWRVVTELVCVRDLLQRRVCRIVECGGDPYVTMRHIEALKLLESLLCGSTEVQHLHARLGELAAGGRASITHQELFKLLTVRQLCDET